MFNVNFMETKKSLDTSTIILAVFLVLDCIKFQMFFFRSLCWHCQGCVGLTKKKSLLHVSCGYRIFNKFNQNAPEARSAHNDTKRMKQGHITPPP